MSTLNERLEQATKYLQMLLKVNCPKDTTNLSRNINIEYIDDGKARIIIGNENADYAVYTNMAWKDGVNPNQGWVESTIAQATSIIQQLLSGEIPLEEVSELIVDSKDEYDLQVQEIINEIDNKLNGLKGVN